MIIKKLNNISDIIYTKLDPEDYTFVEEGDNYDAILVRSANLHGVEFPEQLKAIGRAGIGVDNIDIDACSEKGIVVFNTPGANANAVKELVICGMMLAGRKIIEGTEWVRSEEAAALSAEEFAPAMEKAKKAFVGREIAGKTLGVIGLGAIGVMVANAADALDMDVVGYDPYLSVESALKLSRNVKIVKSKEELLKASDFVTMHLHLTPDTKDTIGTKELEIMKDGSVVLNYARGGLANDDAILAALESGKLAAYVTDFPDAKLAGKPGVIATPHLGGSTPEAEENCARLAAKELNLFLRFGKIKNSVNFPDCDLPYESGCRLCIFNRNITNMIGQITGVLTEQNVNIEHMLNRSKGDYAYTVIDIKDKISDEAIAAIQAIDGVIRVRVIG